VLDNYGPPRPSQGQGLVRSQPRFHFHFVPTGSSWLNLIETWLSQLTNRAIRRGSFGGVGESVTAIHAYIEAHNSDPKPFIWTASIEAILEKVNRCRTVLDPSSV
jgi:transposase